MSNSIDSKDIRYATIGGIVTIDDKLYECEQILQSLVMQGYPIKKFGSVLKVGNQVISPISPLSNIPVSNPDAQDIIQKQFKQLFEEINHLREQINAKTQDFSNEKYSSYLSEKEISEPPLTHLDQTTNSLLKQLEPPQNSGKNLEGNNNYQEEKNWENLIQPGQYPPHKKFDVGESNLQRKWSSLSNNTPLTEKSKQDAKYRTEYYSLGMKKRNSSSKVLNTPLNREQFNETVLSGPEVSTKPNYDESSLEDLAEELVSRIDKSLVCPKCLNTLPSSAYFCSRCGLKVQKKDIKIPKVYEPDVETKK